MNTLREKIEEASERDREALLTRIKACRADACEQGRMPCPCPQACSMPDDGTRVGLGLFVCVVCAVSVIALVAVLWP